MLEMVEQMEVTGYATSETKYYPDARALQSYKNKNPMFQGVHTTRKERACQASIVQFFSFSPRRFPFSFVTTRFHVGNCTWINGKRGIKSLL